MTVVKAFMIRRRNGGPNSRLIQTFLREGTHVQIFFRFVLRLLTTSVFSIGVFYYILIAIANLVNGIFYLQYVLYQFLL